MASRFLRALEESLWRAATRVAVGGMDSVLAVEFGRSWAGLSPAGVSRRAIPTGPMPGVRSSVAKSAVTDDAALVT
jgi:hypothetical protein